MRASYRFGAFRQPIDQGGPRPTPLPLWTLRTSFRKQDSPHESAALRKILESKAGTQAEKLEAFPRSTNRQFSCWPKWPEKLIHALSLRIASATSCCATIEYLSKTERVRQPPIFMMTPRRSRIDVQAAHGKPSLASKNSARLPVCADGYRRAVARCTVHIF